MSQIQDRILHFQGELKERENPNILIITKTVIHLMHWSLKDHEHSKWGKWILNATSKKCICTCDNYVAQLIYVKEKKEKGARNATGIL